ncbi:MAG: M48 family metallopeptidase [Verrucomicrobiota bacterium]|nr:M48 family metallopeptidase [Verrucomicrobiota bacterium]
MSNKSRLLTGFVALFLLLGVVGCGVAMMSDERLARQSNAQFSQMKKKDPVSKNQGYQRMVEKIGKRITSVAKVDVPGTEWEFVVFDKSEPNAFAMPGGKVGVNVGLIELANGDEDEIAAVIGHEVAHVAKRHSNKRMSQGVGVAIGGIILDTAMRNKSTGDRALARGAYGVGATVGAVLPFSRTQEREADDLGLIYSAKAGYDPRASIRFWQKMKSRTRKRLPQFLSTHPDPGKRIEYLQSKMPFAMSLYRRSQSN